MNLRGAIFDLDGVVTRTAKTHAAAWKVVFDAYLKARAERTGERFSPFGIDGDYRTFVDGKPRYDGVDAFFRSRGIRLPWGMPDDPPEKETVCGIGNRKNVVFNQLLANAKPEVIDGVAPFLSMLRRAGVRIAVATSSKNGRRILDLAGLREDFDIIVDGNDAARERLPGKPDPATFLYAAKLLQVEPQEAAVFEDAVAGITAGVRGGFQLVVGVGDKTTRDLLRKAGADVVIESFHELSPERLFEMGEAGRRERTASERTMEEERP